MGQSLKILTFILFWGRKKRQFQALIPSNEKERTKNCTSIKTVNIHDTQGLPF